MRFTEDKTLSDGQWTVFKEAHYVDDHGVPQVWQYVERRAGRAAVAVVPVTERTGTLILIRQFRIPFKREIVEFPAGLIDPNEQPEETAKRELLEETGFSGRIEEIGPEVCTSPGITTEIVTMVRMSVGEEPVKPQQLEGSERIKVIRVRRGEERELVSRLTSEGLVFDAKVYLYLAARAAGW